MATEEVIIWRIFHRRNVHVVADISVPRRIMMTHTNLLDTNKPPVEGGLSACVNVVVTEKKFALFWAYMLNRDDKRLATLKIRIREIHFLVEFQRRFIKPNDELTAKFQAWFLIRWGNFKTTIPKAENNTYQLLRFTVLAAQIREPRTFHEATYQWFLHSKGSEEIDIITLRKDDAYLRPVLMNLMAARTGFTQKLEHYLALNRKKDGHAQSLRCPSQVCAANTTFAYYHALRKTFCWPVWRASLTHSIYEILEDLKKFKYVPCDKILAEQDEAKKARRNFWGYASYERTPSDTKKSDQSASHDDKTASPSDPDCNCTDVHFRALEKKVHYASNAMLCKWDAHGRIDCFRGMCLDCVLNTGGEDVDEVYWQHVGNGVFDAGFGEGKACAMKHGQPDWYYSFMGRAELRHKYGKLD